MIVAAHKHALSLGQRAWHFATGRARCIRELEKTQWLDRAAIAALQRERLRCLLDHAYERVPFYRQRLRELSYSPGAPLDIDLFRRLPIVTKEHMQEHLSLLMAQGVAGRENHTGGSIGRPLTFYQDRTYWNYNLADKIRTYRMCGYEIGEPVVFLWGSDLDSRQHNSFAGRLFDRVARNLVWINTFRMGEHDMPTYADVMARFQPALIVGYAISLWDFARRMKEWGRSDISPRAIQSSAEVLTPDMRAEIEEAFHCPVFDRYGGREVGIVAHECSAHSGLHILAENQYVEFLDDEGREVQPGKEANIVVTNLSNYAMPFIRYRTDDVGIASERTACPCGRGLPLMEVVQGRRFDIIRSPSGKHLHGQFFTSLFFRVQGVRQFQVVQEDERNLTVRIVPAPGFDESALTVLERGILDMGDAAFNVRFEMCDRIPETASGKRRFIIGLEEQ